MGRKSFNKRQGEKILSLLTFKNSRMLDSSPALDAEKTNNSMLANPKSKYFSHNKGISNPIGTNNSPLSKFKKLKAKNNVPQETQIISGYFIKEKSYKEMVISRINNFLCCILALLVMVCLASYYFVINGEIQLNQIRKETLALNYENEEMQNKLDILQSYTNVDRQVAKTRILQRAKQVMELSAANLPDVDFDNKNKDVSPGWTMGY